jgi:hypothetical protein
MHRGVLRREDILEHGVYTPSNIVIFNFAVYKGENARNFAGLFEQVQERLRRLFGMEMVPVPNAKLKCKRTKI